MINANDTVRITKGCRYLNISKGEKALVVSAKEMGADYGHNCHVTLKFNRSGKTFTLVVRHLNRLGDAQVSAHNGNPLNKVVFERV